MRPHISTRSRHKRAVTPATGGRHAANMNGSADDDLLLDMIESVALDVLSRIGNEPDARFVFFKKLVVLAQQTVRQAEPGKQTSSYQADQPEAGSLRWPPAGRHASCRQKASSCDRSRSGGPTTGECRKRGLTCQNWK